MKHGDTIGQDFAMIEELISESVKKSRSLAGGLYPLHISDQGLVDAIKHLVEQTQELYKIRCCYTGVKEVDLPLSYIEMSHLKL